MIRAIHDAVWGSWLLALFLGAGICFTIRLRGFQALSVRGWWSETAGILLKGGDGARGQLSTVCTALAATVGTGNIAGVATALAAGGPGAVFWMWAAAFLGMATAYAETYLGLCFRRKRADGSYLCGPFVYLEEGFKSRAPGSVYAFFCVVASLGMGSMVQANSISESAACAFSLPPFWAGAFVTAFVMAVIFGGIRRISDLAARLVPFSAGLYMALCLTVILGYYDRVPAALGEIFTSAFRPESAAGGVLGYGMKHAIRFGVARGVFSNEAGLGSLAVLHGSAGEDASPRQQGLWAVFEVFFDTIVSCTLTALAVLCVSGGGRGLHAGSGMDGSAMVTACFSHCFGTIGGWLTALSMSLFAFATIIAWFYLGQQAVCYLAGDGRFVRAACLLYGSLYLCAVFFGCVSRMELVWQLSDIFNGLMAAPNLLGLLILSGRVEKPYRNGLQTEKKKPLQQ